MLCACVGDDLPVMHTVHEGSVRYHGAEQVVSLEEERVSIVSREVYFF